MFVIHIVFFFKNSLIWNNFIIILMFLFQNLIIFILFWQLIVIWFIKSCVDFSTNIFLSASLFMRFIIILMFDFYFDKFVFWNANVNVCALKLRVVSTKIFSWCLNFFSSNYSFFDWFFAWFSLFCSLFVTRQHFYFS